MAKLTRNTLKYMGAKAKDNFDAAYMSKAAENS